MKCSPIYPTLADQYFSDVNGPVLSSAPVNALCGTNHTYTLEPSQLDRHPVQHRKTLWDDFLTLLPVRPQKIYCLTGPCPEQSNAFIINHRYFPSVCHQMSLPDYFDCFWYSRRNGILHFPIICAEKCRRYLMGQAEAEFNVIHMGGKMMPVE